MKATREGYTEQKKRLKIKVAKNTIKKLSSYPALTYIVGIDEDREIGYIISANSENQKSLTSLSTKFLINEKIQNMLWQEVSEFWGK